MADDAHSTPAPYVQITPADPAHLARAVPLSLWPEATRLHHLRRDQLQTGLERLENLREWMVAKLDELDGDPDLEPSLGAAEAEPAAFTRRGVDSLDQRRWSKGASDDREADGDRYAPSDSDFEPSLGSGGGTAAGGPRQIHWARRGHGFLLDGEEEHDGCEPEEDQNTGDDEPDANDYPVPVYVSDHDQMHRAASSVFGPDMIDASMGAR